MRTIELNTEIEGDGTVRLPEEYRNLYGKAARILILVSDENTSDETSDRSDFRALLEKTRGVWKHEHGDGLTYQNRLRDEWERQNNA